MSSAERDDGIASTIAIETLCTAMQQDKRWKMKTAEASVDQLLGVNASRPVTFGFGVVRECFSNQRQ